ncbi:MAG: GNAT family N-acetyltransferase [Actinomycetota bacterium]|nr:GNAT family N-acetyltransferase [Actinomycetota bacterium]
MAADIRIPGDGHREEIARCISRSLNFPLERALARAPRLPIEDFRCAFEDGRVVATAAEHHFVQWFRGRPVQMSGIWAVSTLPEHRETGLASAAVRRLLEDARGRGVPISALFPAVLRPYRRLGYELAGTFTDHRVPLEALPASRDDDLPPVEIADIERDLDGVQSCYHEWVQHNHATLEPTDDRWWTERIFDDGGEESFSAVVVRDAGTITGFATFKHVKDPGQLDVTFGLECSSFVALDARAVRALLAYFRGFRGLGRWVEWTGPPQDPISLLIDEQELIQRFRFQWMLRVLDVPGALASRGWPGIDDNAIFAVDDPMFPDNAGPWRLSVGEGKATVDPVSPAEAARSPRPIAIGAFSSMFTGFLRVADAVRLGILDRDDPATPALARLLSGPDPWSPFFF